MRFRRWWRLPSGGPINVASRCRPTPTDWKGARASAVIVTGVEVAEVEVEPRAKPLPEPGPAPFLVVDAGAAGRIVDWIALAWGREPAGPPR